MALRNRSSPREGSGNPAKASLWYGAALYLNTALLFLATPIFTRFLTTSEYGEVVLYNSWVAVLGLFATLSLSAGVFQTSMLEFEDDLDVYTSSMIGLSTVAVVLCFTLVSGVIALTHDFVGLGGFLLVFMFLGFLFNSTLKFWQARERFYFRYRLMSALTISSSVVGVLAAVLLVVFVPVHRVESRIVGAALPAVLVGIVMHVALLRTGKVFFSRRYWSHALTLNIPLLPHYISQALILQFDRFAIERSSGKEEVGIYGLAYAVTSGATLFWTAISASWTPWMLKRIKDGNFTDIAAKAADLTMAIALVCILLALAAPELVALLAPDSYRSAAEVVPVLLLATYFQSLASLFTTVQFYRTRSVAMTACSVLAAILNVAGNLWFIGVFGFEAAAYVIAASQLFQLVFHYAMVRGMDGTRVIDGWRMVLLTAGTVLLLIIAVVERHSLVLRVFLFALFAAALALLAYRRLGASTSGGRHHA